MIERQYLKGENDEGFWRSKSLLLFEKTKLRSECFRVERTVSTLLETLSQLF